MNTAEGEVFPQEGGPRPTGDGVENLHPGQAFVSPPQGPDKEVRLEVGDGSQDSQSHPQSEVKAPA